MYRFNIFVQSSSYPALITYLESMSGTSLLFTNSTRNGETPALNSHFHHTKVRGLQCFPPIISPTPALHRVRARQPRELAHRQPRVRWEATRVNDGIRSGERPPSLPRGTTTLSGPVRETDVRLLAASRARWSLRAAATAVPLAEVCEERPQRGETGADDADVGFDDGPDDGLHLGICRLFSD